MLGKIATTALIGIFAVFGYSEVTEQAESIMHESSVIGSSLQEREITTALEIYWLRYNSYPEVIDEDVIKILYEADLLKSTVVSYSLSYSTTKNGQRFELEVS